MARPPPLILALLVIHASLVALSPVGAQEADAYLELSASIPQGVKDYSVATKSGALFFSWVSGLPGGSGGSGAAQLGSFNAQILVDVYPGFAALTISVAGSFSSGDTRIYTYLSGSGGGGALEGGVLGLDVSGFIASDNMRVDIDISASIDANLIELKVSLEPGSPSSLPLFAVVSGLASQAARQLADSLEANGFNVELDEERNLSTHRVVLIATPSGSDATDGLTALLGLAGPIAPLLLSVTLTEPTLLVDEPLATLRITVSLTGGENPELLVSGSATSSVALFSDATVDREESTTRVVLHGSQLLVESLGNALCSHGLAECSDREPLAVSGSYRAVEAAFLEVVAVPSEGFLEFSGWMQAVKPFTVKAGGYTIVLPEGGEALLLGVEFLEPQVYSVYGNFTEAIVLSDKPFAAVGPGYTLSPDGSDGVYTITLYGPGSFVLSPPQESGEEQREAVTVTVTRTVPTTVTITEVVSETVTTTVTVTLTHMEGATQQTQGAGESVTLIAIAGAVIAIAAPIIAYALLVRGR